ncbi:MAG TPA: redoxin domain-containing protein [Tepidisphaeraceae bacterium]|nr:redoxin domain-containing protein [Tepidisphaeraceae bacterium]
MSKNLIALVVALFVGAALTVAAVTQPPPIIGSPAPQFALQDQDGKEVKLSDFAGKIVVLEWFNEECPIVQRHYKADTMNTLSAKYKGKNVVWLAINSTKGKTNADNKKAAAAWHMERPILNDASGKTGHAYQSTNTPGMYVVDAKGNLAYWGGIDDNINGDKATVKNYVSQTLDELLAGQTVSQPKTQPYGCTVKYAD